MPPTNTPRTASSARKTPQATPKKGQPLASRFAPAGSVVDDAPPETVSPIWILKALGLTMVAALICAWLALCLLVYQGQWQLVLHPAKKIDATPNVPYQDVRFDAATTGTPRLSGWWIPAAEDGAYKATTVLFLHDGSGSLANTVPMIATLHQAGLQVFAFDYRGFGTSDAIHPTQARMTDDAAAALDYLVNTRHVPASSIVLYGDGLGAALATGLAHQHPEISAVILAHPQPDVASTIVGEHRMHLVPMSVLFRERFEIAEPLATLSTPKLLIADEAEPGSGASASQSESARQGASARQVDALYRKAATPSIIVHLEPQHRDTDLQQAISRFIDQVHPGSH